MQTSLLLCENELDFLDVGAGILGETNPSHQQWDEKNTDWNLSVFKMVLLFGQKCKCK